MIDEDVKRLSTWFNRSKRDLPWRRDKSPYRVWVSEVMLQQTQAVVVVPYFEKFIKQYPTVESLAKTSIEKLIKVWEGLGYYSRVRNLHHAAKQIVHELRGKIPADPSELKKLKGFGNYTANAVAAFAYGQRVAPVDGNVLRVISRYYVMDDDVALQSTKLKVEAKVESFLPNQNAHVVSEALIELGAKICMKQPKCMICPIREGCQAKKKGQTESYPRKAKTKPITQLHRVVGIIEHAGSFLVTKRKEGEVMADLWEFPYFDVKNSTEASGFTWEKLPVEVVHIKPLRSVKHTFTRYRSTLYPYRVEVRKPCNWSGHVWIPQEKLLDLPFSSGHRNILSNLLSE